MDNNNLSMKEIILKVIIVAVAIIIGIFIYVSGVKYNESNIEKSQNTMHTVTELAINFNNENYGLCI